MNKLISNNYCDSANYTGIVTVSVYSKETLVSSVTSHNTGMSKLFTFINSCLAGDFQAAKSSRPCKILLLKESTLSENNIISTPVVYDRAAQATLEETGGSISYHFRIPSLCLAVGEGNTVKELLLLPATYTSLEKDACARFTLASPINLPEKSNNITIIVD